MKKLSKDEIWNHYTQETNRVTDGLGMPIDAEIKPIVTALNCMGFVTVMSCEGHDRKTFASSPWIRIEAVTIEDDSKLKEEDYIKVRRTARKNKQKLYKLLTEFYSVNTSNIDSKLTLDDSWIGAYTLQNMGAGEIDILPKKERHIKRKQYREEMNKFAAFLKDKFYEERDNT